MNIDEIKNHKVGMILQFSLPAIISMVLTAFITITDGFFIGNYVGPEGLAAVNLGCPIIYFFLAVGLMISVGGVSISGRLFGAQKIDECRNVFSQTMSTVVVVSVLSSVITFVLLKPIQFAVGATGIVANYYYDYYTILLFELPLMIINSSLGMFIRGEGSPAYFMNTNILNVVLNIFLDYLFVAKFNLGVKGIAFASVIAAIISFIPNILFFFTKSKVYKFRKFVFSKKDFKETILNGCSEFIGEMAMCVAMYSYNFVILRKAGVDGITAFTVVGYISYIFSMIICGFGQGIVPLVGFAFGAKEYQLAKKLRKITNTFILASAAVVMLVMFFCSRWYSQMFTKSESISAMINYGVLIYMFSFPLAGFNTISSFYFN